MTLCNIFIPLWGMLFVWQQKGILSQFLWFLATKRNSVASYITCFLSAYLVFANRMEFCVFVQKLTCFNSLAVPVKHTVGCGSVKGDKTFDREFFSVKLFVSFFLLPSGFGCFFKQSTLNVCLLYIFNMLNFLYEICQNL